MNAEQSRWTAKLMACVVVFFLALSTSKKLVAGELAYRIEPFGAEASPQVTGGYITTDGTLGETGK